MSLFETFLPVIIVVGITIFLTIIDCLKEDPLRVHTDRILPLCLASALITGFPTLVIVFIYTIIKYG